MYRIGNAANSGCNTKWLRTDNYKAQCDRTGFMVPASELRKEWQGLQVRKKSWERRQPQDSVRAKKDNLVLPVSRPTALQKVQPENVDLPFNEF